MLQQHQGVESHQLPEHKALLASNSSPQLQGLRVGPSHPLTECRT